jgi:hypothetical protein
MDYKGILIIINNRNRLKSLCQLITWLQERGYWNLMVLDNDSDYPPLLEYYDCLEGMVNVVKLGRNLLSKALWCWTASRQSIFGPFVYTDSDIVPIDECPENIVECLWEVAEQYGMPNKVGLGLKINDIPDHYSQAERVRKWEARFWKREIGYCNYAPVYSAAVDTTFALYPEFRPFSLNAIRTGYPMIARHLPWYSDSANPTEEETYYEQHASLACHCWGVSDCFSDGVRKECDRET